jgi:hypothetical protein
MERLGWVATFDRVAAGTPGTARPGWQISDSEVVNAASSTGWQQVVISLTFMARRPSWRDLLGGSVGRVSGPPDQGTKTYRQSSM